jgi:hypothetical protein
VLESLLGAASAASLSGTGGQSVAPQVASAALGVETLIADDTSASDAWGESTLGGQPAQVSH